MMLNQGMTTEQNDDRMTVITVPMTRGEWAEAVLALNAARNFFHGGGNYLATTACALDLERISTILGRAS